MNIPLCTKCNKNPAMIFMTKFENNQQVDEGLCLKCASEMGLKPVEDIMKKMGITTEDIESIAQDLPENFTDIQNMMEGFTDEELLANINTADISKMAESILGSEKTEPKVEMSEEKPEKTNFFEKFTNKSSKKEEKKYKFLNEYSINLSKKAKKNEIDDVIGREDELTRVIQILNRRQKNNPCLIGEPGVGKTAVAEALAMAIYKKEVPYKLQDKEVYSLDITSLVAGTQFRGQFESRMKGLIKDIETHGNVILVIDEVHNLVGAGDSEGSMNAANILKPALSRGLVQVVGATTFAEYRKYIEKDGALERRFQPVTVVEPSIKSAIKMLVATKSYYEEFHKVNITESMIREAVVLSERYITDRFLPDKAIDLLDEACSQINLNNKTISEIYKVENELKEVTIAKEALESEVLTSENNEEQYKEIADLKSKLIRLNASLDNLKSMENPSLEVRDLAKVIEFWTKIPASKVETEEIHKLLGLEERLSKRIIGQDEAITAIAKGVRRTRAGVSPKKKPTSFIFVGPTGVGKTELTKALTEDLFDTPDSLIRLDMSEFMEKHSVSRLIGAPPGYVGYEEAGQLTEKVRRRPYSVILFDELEKAHPDVLNSLLQILDDGKITDASGRVVNFENTVIIMTSNAGSADSTGNLGFGKSVTDGNKAKSEKALNAFLRPEFINRIDKIITFNSLSHENFVLIAKKMMLELKETLHEKGIELDCSDDVYEYLAKKAYSIKFGARNLRRTIDEVLLDDISLKIINSYNEPLTKLEISTENEEIQILSK